MNSKYDYLPYSEEVEDKCRELRPGQSESGDDLESESGDHGGFPKRNGWKNDPSSKTNENGEALAKAGRKKARSRRKNRRVNEGEGRLTIFEKKIDRARKEEKQVGV